MLKKYQKNGLTKDLINQFSILNGSKYLLFSIYTS